MLKKGFARIAGLALRAILYAYSRAEQSSQQPTFKIEIACVANGESLE
jgi:hypothetical protein